VSPFLTALALFVVWAPVKIFVATLGAISGVGRFTKTRYWWREWFEYLAFTELGLAVLALILHQPWSVGVEAVAAGLFTVVALWLRRPPRRRKRVFRTLGHKAQAALARLVTAPPPTPA